MFTIDQLKYVAHKANKIGAKGLRLVDIVPPYLSTQSEFDFSFVTERPNQNTSDTDWRDE